MQFLGSGAARAAAVATTSSGKVKSAAATPAPAAGAGVGAGAVTSAMAALRPLADGLDTGRFLSRQKGPLRLMLDIMACSAPAAEGQTPMRRVRIETSEAKHIIEFWALGTSNDITHRVTALANHFWEGRPGNRLEEVHVNAWYTTTASPADARKLAGTTLKHGELVFDVDMNDYADVRSELCTCGSNKSICKVCVWLMHSATKILVDALRRQFQYRHIMCCFSGRRGVHVHVHDTHACALTNAERRSVTLALSCPTRSGAVDHRPIAAAAAADPDAKDTDVPRGAFYCPFPLKTQDVHDIGLCMPFFVRTYVHHKGIADTEAALLRFLTHSNAPHAKRSGCGIGMSDKDAKEALRDFCDTTRVRDQPGLAQWSPKTSVDAPLPFAFGAFNAGVAAAAKSAALPLSSDAKAVGVGERVWTAFYAHATLGEYGLLRPRRDARNQLLWTTVVQRFHIWLLTRFRPRLDFNVTPKVDHDVRMPWSVHPGTGRPVLPFDPDAATDALLDFSDATEATQRRAIAEALRVTRALHSELVLQPRRAQPSLDF